MYSTAKELMEKENITRTTLEKDIARYSYEIKEVFSLPCHENYITTKAYPDYIHKYKINLDVCEQLKQTYLDSIQKGEKAEITQPELFQIVKILDNYEKDNSIRYKRKHGGRLNNLYITGNVCLQSLSKKTREKIFKGNFSYDISTSAPSILQQLSVKYFNYDMPIVRDYIQNKEKYRNDLVNIGLTYKEAKAFYTALFFGASLKDNFFFGGNSAFSRMFGVAKIREILEKSPLVVSLQVELSSFIKKFGKVLREKNVVRGKDGKYYLHNGRGSAKEVDLSKWNNPKAILFYYFGEESMILDLLLKKYSHNLLLYDGFISSEEFDVQEMSRYIKEKTAYELKFSKELI